MILAGWAGVFAFKILSGWASFEYTNFFLFLLGDGGRNCETRTISCNFFILFLEISYLIFVQDLMTWSTWKTKTLFNFFLVDSVYWDWACLLVVVAVVAVDAVVAAGHLQNLQTCKLFWWQNFLATKLKEIFSRVPPEGKSSTKI